MVLAEALLRVPDAATADRLIEDKLAAGRLSPPRGALGRAAGLGLGLGARPVGAASSSRGETPEGIVASAGQAARPAGGAHRDAPGDAAARLAFRARPDHRARRSTRAGGATASYRYSFDMLGEGARTAADAERYFDVLCGRDRGDRREPPATRAARPARHLGQALGAASALRGGLARARAARARAARARARARSAKAHDLNFTVDAEEADRLELSLEVLGARAGRPVARRLGRLRPRRSRPTRSARRAVIDWLVDARRDARPPADGAAGQGRLLGHRDQARAGARARRLSGVHPQGR